MLSLLISALLTVAQPQQVETSTAPAAVCLTNACSERPALLDAPPAAEKPKPYVGPAGSVYDRISQRPDMSSDEIVAMLRAENFPLAEFTDLRLGERLEGRLVTGSSGQQSWAIMKRNADGRPGPMMVPGNLPYCGSAAARDGVPCRARP